MYGYGYMYGYGFLTSGAFSPILLVDTSLNELIDSSGDQLTCGCG